MCWPVWSLIGLDLIFSLIMSFWYSKLCLSLFHLRWLITCRANFTLLMFNRESSESFKDHLKWYQKYGYTILSVFNLNAWIFTPFDNILIVDKVLQVFTCKIFYRFSALYNTSVQPHKNETCNFSNWQWPISSDT